MTYHDFLKRLRYKNSVSIYLLCKEKKNNTQHRKHYNIIIIFFCYFACSCVTNIFKLLVSYLENKQTRKRKTKKKDKFQDGNLVGFNRQLYICRKRSSFSIHPFGQCYLLFLITIYLVWSSEAKGIMQCKLNSPKCWSTLLVRQENTIFLLFSLPIKSHYFYQYYQWKNSLSREGRTC